MLGCMIETSVLISAAAHLAELCDYLDLDGNMLITNDPYLGVATQRGMLSFANAPEKYGLRVQPRPASTATAAPSRSSLWAWNSTASKSGSRPRGWRGKGCSSAPRPGNTPAGWGRFMTARATSGAAGSPRAVSKRIASPNTPRCSKRSAWTRPITPSPRRPLLQGLAASVPEDFRFGFKVTDAITLKKFPNLPRFGVRAGKPNGDFLNAGLFADSFLAPCESIRPRVGLLMFEFSRFYPADYPQGRDFAADLDRFLGRLPQGWPYGVELRNHAWLKPDYFDCLARHRVAHVFNSWDAMPSVSEQMALPGSRTNPSLVAARFLLKPGRKYEQAVKSFAPYDSVKEENPEARTAGRALVAEGRAASPKRATFLFVNNRLEGNALGTIAAMLEAEAAPSIG